MRNKNIYHKLLSLLLCLALLLPYLPISVVTAVDNGRGLELVANSKTADPSTLNGWETYFGPGKMDTEFAGAVWTDKSVFTGATNALPGISLSDGNNFLVALSAIASNLSITGHTSVPADTLLVLDLSGSMVDGTVSIGYTRWRNNDYRQTYAVDMSQINAMIDATNATIHKLMQQNTNNRVGVILYSGNTSANQAATAASATVVLPLGRYTGVNSQYLSVDAETITSQLYTRQGRNWVSAGTSDPYVASGTSIYVSVADGLKTESGATVTDASKEVVGGTYIQNGFYKAMEEFLKVTDTVVPAGKPQEGVGRMPVMVLMSDGAPTIATTDYTAVGNSNTGSGQSTSNTITFLTQLTAAYAKGKIAEHYNRDDVLFYTLGLGTENSSAATNTLYPAGSNTTLQGYWNTYLAAANNSNVTVTDGLTVPRSSAVAAMNYVDKYFYASNAADLVTSFEDIVSEIQLKAEAYTTLVENNNANLSGYVTFEDELGELMQVYKVSGILVGNQLFTGEEIAKGMTDGNLGTPAGPTERGDELVRTVKERIPGITTTQAQQLINSAYLDQQLYHDEATGKWSNYIGWYADSEGNYLGFWDKDSGYTNAPAGAKYANRSYGYLGENKASDMMHVVVQVRTELTTLHQTMLFKVPAALLPTVQYRVTLAENNPASVEEFHREGAEPIRLVFEVGIREDLNSVNLQEKIKEHQQKGGHVHQDENTGVVTFYTNEFKIGNDTNGNGIPDANEVDNAIVTQAHFHPALDNSRFYYTEDTVILTGNGDTVTSANRPTHTDSDASNGTGYFYNRYIYRANGRTAIQTPIAATTLANDAQYADGRWYIPAGTMYHNLARFKTPKSSNSSGTLDYSFFPAVFDAVSKQDVYMFLGNNGAIQAVPATGFTLNKQLQGTIPGVDRYTFRVTLSNIPAGATAAPKLTDANGATLSNVTMSDMSNNVFTVTMPAGVTAYISGIPVGTTVTVEEQIGGDYKIVGIDVAGQAQTGSASFTVPAFDKQNPGAQMVPVTFTNAPNGYGNLVITKDVTHSLSSDPAELARKEFTFKVTLTGEKLKANDTFATSDENTTVTVATAGSVTFEVKLCNEESLTIYRLPEGTAYSVEEINIPEGFTPNQATFSGVITADVAQTAPYINAYDYDPAEIYVDLIINKDLQGSPLNPETFTFLLQELKVGSAPNTIGTFTIASDAVDKVALGAIQRNFDTIGSYSYQILEQAPTPLTPGMTYSTVRAQFTVLVTDTDMDGKLEINLRNDAHMDALDPNNTDPEAVTRVAAEVTFTNIYELHSTNVQLDIQKELTNETGVEIPLTQFQFGLYAVDASGNATGNPLQTVTSNILGKATFDLFINQAAIAANNGHQFTYIIKELVPANAVLNTQTGKYQLNGMTYDPTEYLVNIDVTAGADGQLNAVTTITKKGDATNTPVTDILFANTYALTETKTYISISKVFTGRELNAGEIFQARLERTDDTFKPYPDGHSNKWFADYTLPVNGSSNVELTFQKAGTYHYRFTELIPAGGNSKGMTYDTAEYHITITVTDSNTGALVAATTIHKLGQAAAVSGVTFTNTYTVSGEGSVTIGGKKELSGRKLAAGEFTIGLYKDANCTDLIESIPNNANGSFAFGKLTYNAVEHLGDNNAAKTFTYYVKEIIPANAVRNPQTGKYQLNGITYDETVHTVTVTVSHDGEGKLVVTPSANAATLVIRNTYAAKDVTATINGKKVLSGNWDAVQNKNFTFQLFPADEKFALTSLTPIATKTVNGNGNFSFSLSFTELQEGFHYYVLKEDTSAEAGGVGYDAGEYHITVNVTDPGNGQLVATVTMYRPGTGNTQTAVFTNSYSVTSTTVTLTGNKTFVNSVTGQNVAMNEGDFSFLVLKGTEVVATGYNKADGTIQFSPIRYTAPGVHTYTIVEEAGEAGGVTYDLNTSYTVVVTVTDNGDGTLTATADYQGKTVVFNNTYTAEAAQVTFNGNKALENKTLEADKFHFWLYTTDSAFSIAGLTPVEKSNAATGSFSFGTLTYTAPGTYYYRLVEKNGGQSINGITYSKVGYNITVVVTDNGAGQLIPTVTVAVTDAVTGQAAPTVAVQGVSATVNGLNFTNSYAAKPATYTPVAHKDYKGGDMKTFDFVLSGEGFAQQAKQNGTDGNVTFDTLTFDRVGEYTFTISEQKNALWGFIRWDVNVYKLTVKVTDDGAGQLVIDSVAVTSTLGTNDLVFHNTHEDLITDKDVFLSSAPTVSIDGKKVQVGDELVYTISYTNYTGKTVSKVTVTDKLPASLAYVEGSADKGGVFAEGAVTWQLTDVPAGQTVTVSFRAKVQSTQSAVTNTATVVDDENTYTTKEVINPVTDDEMEKTVANAKTPSISIDGQKVEVGDVLLYTITYRNNDDQAAKVTITDTLSQYVAYVDGSADNGGVYADGAVVWTLELAAGQSKTVSFRATVIKAGATITNQAQSFDGTNKLESNAVTTYTPAPPATPVTGDEMDLILWLSLLLISAAGMTALMVSRKRLFR